MPGNTQVARIDGQGNYVREKSMPLKTYMGEMVNIQKLLIAKFGVKARNKDVTK